MIDCAATNSCMLPMWIQYLIVLVGLALLMIKCLWPRDPMDRM